MTPAFFARQDDESGRTRIKFCGFTRAEDVDAAVALGVDALGFVFYPKSPRALSFEQARALVARVPPSIATVGLVVDASSDELARLLDAVPLTALQLHGDETPEQVRAIDRPRIKAARVEPNLDLLEFARLHAAADLLLLDHYSAGYGGSGLSFDWSLVPASMIGPTARPRIMISGGLHAGNVAEALNRLRPFAVDTSSGIESAKGIKDVHAMKAFVAAVRDHDRMTNTKDR
jgi:phosphoribosylanthranilate isomerase